MTAPIQAIQFLQVIAPGTKIFTFQAIDDSPAKRQHLAAIRHGSLEECDPWLSAKNDAGAGIFVTINETDFKGRKAANIVRCRAVWADFDDGRPDTVDRLIALHTPPSIIVKTSPDNFHAYWPVTGLTREEFPTLQKRVSAQLGSDEKVNDLPRVMRLPGYLHRKTANAHPVSLVLLSEKTYSRDELFEQFAAAPIEPREPETASPTSGMNRYAAAALKSACSTIENAAEGSRNDTLNTEAFGIAQLVAGGEIEETEARESLTNAAEHAGLGAAEIAQTLTSAFDAGSKKPRNAPVSESGPLPLLRETEGPTPYPMDSLPQLMRDAVEAISEHVGGPEAIAGQCVLGAAAFLAQSRVNAPSITHPGGMPCALFQLTLADSGERKTETSNLAFKVIDEAEATARTLHKLACKSIDAQADSLKGKQREKWLEDNPRPADPQTQYSDATWERIVGNMIRGTSSASWKSDEGGQVLGGASLKADNRAATLGGLTKAFDNGSFERARSHGNAEGSGFAYNRRLSVHLLAQPVTIASALSDPLLLGQGFLARFCLAAPASTAGTRFLTAEKLSRKAYSDPRLQRYWARCTELGNLPQAIDPETGEIKPPVLELSDSALEVWISFYNEVENELSALGKFANLKPFANRSGEISRRIAAVLAFFEGLDSIDDTCMTRAVELARYSLNEWSRYTDADVVDPKISQAIALMEWLQEKNWQQFDARRLQREGPSFARKSAKQRDQVLAVLIEHRQLVTADGKHFSINSPTKQECSGFEDLV